MQLVQLEAFITVARMGSFTQAADTLHLTQPAVTRQIAALELELQTRLFDRLGRSIQLTAAGEALIEYARRMLQLESDAKQAVLDIRTGETGRLRIGASSTLATYVLPDLLKSFRETRPLVEISMHTGVSSQVIGMLRENAVDIGFVTSETTDELFTSIALGEFETCVVTPSGHLLCEKRAISTEDLAGIPLILMEPGTNLRTYVDRLLNAAGVQEQVSMELDNVEAIKRMIEAGLGISMLPEVSVRHEVDAGRLVALHLADVPGASRKIRMIHRKDKYIHMLMMLFMRHVAPESV